MKPKILIRTDGGIQIGHGHLVRCLALAQILKDDFEIIFYCKEIPETIVPELKVCCIICNKIETEDEFLRQLNHNTIAVLDGYHFDTDFQKQIKSTGSKLVCIDDIHDKEFVADLIINHAPGVSSVDYQAQSYTQFALGLEFSLIRSKFLEQAKISRKIEKIDTVFICFGGSDAENITHSTLKAVTELEQLKKIFVVTGSEYQFADSINTIADTDNRVKHFHSVGEAKMLDLMLHAELAIVPASGISIEILHVGAILLTGTTAENQKIIYNGLIKMNNVYGIGNFNHLDATKLITTIQKVLTLNTFPINLETIKQNPLNLKFNYVFNRE